MTEKPQKISIITLGCGKNTNDTDNLAAVLKKKGHSVGAKTSEADAVVVHTCSFIESAKKESVEAVLNAADAKPKTAKLYVTGCMVQQHGKEMMEELPEADGFLGTGQLGRLPSLLNEPAVKRFLDRRDPGGYTDPDDEKEWNPTPPTADLRLSEGCSHPCSFCVIPKLRGGLQSRPEEKILEEARRLAESGIQELVIIGQDTGDWGRDLYGERRLGSLLRKLNEVRGIKWIRLMYMHPFSMTQDVISTLAEFPGKFPYLDMPLQHIDDGMLKDMNRLLPESDVRFLIERIKTQAPELSLRTTFIVGYPGETEAQFTRLNDFVNEGWFDYLGAFTYSKENSTPAAVKKNQISEKLKSERQQALMATYFGSCHQKAQKRLGKVEEVVIEGEDEESLLARSRREAPDIDAIIRVPKKGPPLQGPFTTIKLTGYEAFEFTGERLGTA